MTKDGRRTWGSGAEFWSEPKSRWIVRRRDAHDGRTYEATGTTLAAARSKWKANAKARHDEPAASSTSEPVLLAAYLARWLAERLRMNIIGPRTHRTYEMLVRLWIVPVIGDVALEDLEPAHVKAVARHALDEGKSSQWAKHTHTVIRSALADAHRDGLVERNVASVVPAVRVTRRDVVRLTADQVNKFLDDHASHPMYALFVVALTTGLRQGELLGLFWSDIDWKEGTVSVSRTLMPLPGKKAPGRVRARRTQWEELDTKTDASRRTIDLSGFAVSALRAHLHKAASAKLVFARRDGRGPLSPEHVTRTWKALLAESGLPIVPFHASRHTAIAEALDMSGGDLRAARDMAGHSRLATTTDTYGGLARRATKRIADGMDERFGQRKGGNKSGAASS